ncbi:MAG: glycosyltransferase [Nitrospiraceae bacterium]|nr:glycosyltransferase [Nitrospiraceae bacterium]
MERPVYSIIVPAYNEEDLLPGSLAVLKRAMETTPLSGELVVVDNNSTDRTAEVAKKMGARVVFEPINQISRARNAGARVALGKYLVFVDADTFLAPELLQTALDYLDSGQACGGGGLVAFQEGAAPHVQMCIDLWNRLAARFGMAAGCFVYCLREAFDAVGGFSIQMYAGEELRFSRDLRKWGASRGLPFTILREPHIVTSGRKISWYTPTQLAVSFALLLFPFALRSRRLCAYWYERPGAWGGVNGNPAPCSTSGERPLRAISSPPSAPSGLRVTVHVASKRGTAEPVEGPQKKA